MSNLTFPASQSSVHVFFTLEILPPKNDDAKPNLGKINKWRSINQSVNFLYIKSRKPLLTIYG